MVRAHPSAPKALAANCKKLTELSNGKTLLLKSETLGSIPNPAVLKVPCNIGLWCNG